MKAAALVPQSNERLITVAKSPILSMAYNMLNDLISVFGCGEAG
jgi:hypothetical protein